jgi:hypothetical protein
MYYAIEAKHSKTIDGEIVQISFDEDPDQDPFNRTKSQYRKIMNYRESRRIGMTAIKEVLRKRKAFFQRELG